MRPSCNPDNGSHRSTGYCISNYVAFKHCMAGAGALCTPPYHTPPNEETPCHIHAQLGDLNDNEL